MKKYFGIILFLSILCISSSYGELSDNYTLTSSNYYNIEDINGSNLITMDGFYNGGAPGNPMLPYKIYNIILPSNCNLSTVKLEIIKVDGEYINKTLNIKPAPPMVADGINKTIVDYGIGKHIVNGYNINVYGKDSFYPEKPVNIVNKGQLREAKLIAISFNPILYNPVQKKAYHVKKVVFRISYNLMGENHLHSSLSTSDKKYVISSYTKRLLNNYNLLNSGILNTNTVLPAEYNSSSSVKYDYIIVTTNYIKSNAKELNNFTNWLKIRGFNPLVISENDYGNATGQQRAINIRNWLKNHYQTYGIKYVLLIGNPDPDDPLDDSDSYGDIPMMMCYPRYYATDTRESPTDYFYADLTGNWDSDGNGIYGDPNDNVDFYPEVFVGRIPFYGNFTQLNDILIKTIKYENNTGDWRKRVLLPMAISNYKNEDGSWCERTDGRDLPKYLIENILQPLNYSYYVMYERSGLNPVPTTAPYYNVPINKENVINEWNKGYGLVFWWGHGNSWGAYRKYWAYDNNSNGIPERNEMKWVDFINSWDIYNLSDNKPAITYQCSCLNGYPEDSYNLGYSLLKRGAVATVSASRVSWYQIGYWKPDGIADNAEVGYDFSKYLALDYPVGEALYSAKSNLANYYDGGWMMNLMDFNLYGDPSLSLNNKINLNKKIFINHLPYTIEIPGHYILNISCKDLNETAITIDADNVVLDGNGHVLDGNTINWHWKCGIYVNNHKNITIKNLAVKGFDEGIYLYSSSNNTITDVNVSNNSNGIVLGRHSYNNVLTNNIFTNCGLCIWNSYNNKVKNNTVNGKPLVYLENEKDKVIDNAGQVIVINCKNITIRDVSLNNATIGIKLYNVSNSKIFNVNSCNNKYGIIFNRSSKNIMSNITANNDNKYGIYLWGSFNNRLSNVNACNNYDDGIYIMGSSNNTIINVNVSNNCKKGISFESSSNNNINNITGSNNNVVGIFLGSSSNNNTIFNVNVGNNSDGIHLDSSSHNTIINVNADSNKIGIGLDLSSNNTITNNTFKNCGLGVYNSYNNTIKNNTVNGKPLVYLENEKDKVIDNAGQVIAINCKNITLRDMSINNVTDGINFWNVSNSKISNLTVNNNYDKGISLVRLSNNNIITNVTVCNNHYGIYLGSSSHNTIINVNLSNNKDGIGLWGSSNNIICLNNFINNSDGNIYIYTSYIDYSQNNLFHTPNKINYTYNGKTHCNYLGSYYSDYNGTDSNGDGIGDTPYNISYYNNINDRYPLISKFENYKINRIINITPRPDLTVTNIRILKPLIVVNNSYIMYATIKNMGMNDASSFNVSLKDNGNIVATRTINSLNANSIETIMFNWKPLTVGNHTLTVVVDRNNQVNETNESNNKYSAVVYVYGNILAKLNPEYIISKTGETFNISLEVDDIPKCGGFETIITYNKSILNLTAITLSNVSNNANLKMINTSSGLISLVWFANLPNNSFKVATLSFKALNSGNGNISLQKTTICDSNGTKYSNIITKVTNYCIISRTTINLKKGWNAISLPHRNNITFDNPSNVVEIITYYNNSWKLNRENNLKVLYGYYIYCKNDTTMNVSYNNSSEPSNQPSRIVYPGYNLVGINPATNDYENYNGRVKLSDYILSINNTWIQILDLDGRIYTRNDNIFNIYLEPYKIYWLGMSKEDNLMGRNVN